MNEDILLKSIRFECVSGCSRCCRGVGVVFLNEDDIKNIAVHLKIEKEDLLKDYTKPHNERIILIDKRSKECVFLDNDLCAIYEARPLQCRTYPFWKGIICDEVNLKIEKRFCPGIGKGKLYEGKELEEIHSHGMPSNEG